MCSVGRPAAQEQRMCDVAPHCQLCGSAAPRLHSNWHLRIKNSFAALNQDQAQAEFSRSDNDVGALRGCITWDVH